MPDRALVLFGDRLRNARVHKGLNQEDFGKLALVSGNSQLAYEKGKTSPPVEYLLRLLEHGIDIPYLLTGQRSDGEMTIEQTLLFEMFAKLSHGAREALMTLLMELSGRSINLSDLDAVAARGRSQAAQLLQQGFKPTDQPPEN